MAATQHHRVTEIRHAFDKGNQECIGKTRRHKRQRHTIKRSPAISTQSLRCFFHWRRNALNNADQNQKGYGRERKHLCDPDTRKAIKPAARFNAKEVGNLFSYHTSATEQQCERQTNDKWWRDDRQHSENTQALLKRKTRTRCNKRKRKPKHCGTCGGHQCQPQRAPCNAAAPVANHTGKAPDRGILNVADETIGIKRAIKVLNRTCKHADDRIEYKDTDKGYQQRDGRDNKSITFHHPTFS